jgi:hypothetical protein
LKLFHGASFSKEPASRISRLLDHSTQIKIAKFVGHGELQAAGLSRSRVGQ